MAARLGEQLDLLTHGGRSRPDRQQTMRATLDWSHALLTADEQVVFRRLSIFAGGFTLDAAEEIAAGEGSTGPDVNAALDGLVGRSLVAIDHDRPEPRLWMLEPVRQYAADRLRDAGEYDLVVRRHLEWVVRFAVRAGLRFPTEQLHWSARLRDEQDNLRAGLEASFAGIDHDAALRIAAALWHPWFTMGQPDARAWIVRALRTATDIPDLQRAMALLGAGMLEENALDYPQAVQHLRRALALSRECGARGLEGGVFFALGRAAWSIDVDGRSAAEWFDDALRAFREVGDPFGTGGILALLAGEASGAGDADLAARRAAEALTVGTASGLPQVVGEARRLQAVISTRRGDYAEAKRLLDEVTEAYEQSGDRFQLGVAMIARMHLALARGDVTGTLEPLPTALRLAREDGSGERMLDAVFCAAKVLWHRGRAREAATLLRAGQVAQELRPASVFYDALVTDIEAAVVSAGLDADRIAGRGLSLHRAADLTLRLIAEEMAAAPSAESGPAGGSA